MSERPSNRNLYFASRAQSAVAGYREDMNRFLESVEKEDEINQGVSLITRMIVSPAETITREGNIEKIDTKELLRGFAVAVVKNASAFVDFYGEIIEEKGIGSSNLIRAEVLRTYKKERRIITPKEIQKKIIEVEGNGND